MVTTHPTQHKLIPVDLEKLILQLDAKLPSRVIAYEERPYLELWKCSVEHYMHPVRCKTNHIRKMKLAWLSHGNTGLIDYISPFIRNRKKFEVFRKVILAIK